MDPYNLAWWLSTPFGNPFNSDPPDPSMYDMAFCSAELYLQTVKCYCPKIYPTALAIKIALIIQQSVQDSSTGALPTGTNPTGKIAVVKRDKVYDVEREYLYHDEHPEAAASSPTGILADIINKCKAPLKIGAMLAPSFPDLGADCNCGPFSLGGRFGDKADN